MVPVTNKYQQKPAGTWYLPKGELDELFINNIISLFIKYS
jgi:hypothetical protein